MSSKPKKPKKPPILWLAVDTEGLPASWIPSDGRALEMIVRKIDELEGTVTLAVRPIPSILDE